MNPPVVQALVWASAAVGVLALIVYFLVLARRPQWVRLLNGSGLFFTGLALIQVAVLLPRAAAMGALLTIAVTVALLIAAVVVQSVAALRNRTAWDGTERRANPGDPEPAQ